MTKLNNIKNAITSAGGRKVLQIRKSSPNLMFGLGVAGMIGTVVLASKATLRVEDILDETEELRIQAREVLDSGNEKYSDQDFKQDMVKLYFRQGAKLTKLYAPSVVVGLASVGCLTGAHVTLTRRNAGLMAAYAAVDKGFKEYRNRVIDELGEDKDREFKFGVQEIEEVSQDKKGNEVIKKRNGASRASMYARFFDDSNSNWSNDPETNLFFLKTHQTYLNNQLQARGHVLLNDVFDALDMERTEAGCVVGWVKGNGDDFIDFGIWDPEQIDRTYDFMVGNENCLLLDFNVDGVVYDKI